jgi:hypothetical protein
MGTYRVATQPVVLFPSRGVSYGDRQLRNINMVNTRTFEVNPINGAVTIRHYISSLLLI